MNCIIKYIVNNIKKDEEVDILTLFELFKQYKEGEIEILSVKLGSVSIDFNNIIKYLVL